MDLNQSLSSPLTAQESEAVESQTEFVPPNGSLPNVREALDPSTTRLARAEFQAALATQEIVGIQPNGDFKGVEIVLDNGSVLHPKISHPDMLSIEPLVSEVTVVGGTSADVPVELTFTDGIVRFGGFPMVVVSDPLNLQVFPIREEAPEEDVRPAI